METLFIESNREVAVGLIEQEDSLVVPTTIKDEDITNVSKSFWTTKIDSGILLEAGDQISLESASINIKGIGDGLEFQTFTGEATSNSGLGLNKKDNECELEVNYYVNNNCNFNVPLPLGTATRTDSRGGFFNRTDFGGPSLTGKNIWGVGWTDYTPGLPAGFGDEGFMTMNKYNLDWGMRRGEYFYTTLGNQPGVNYETEAGPKNNVVLPQTNYGVGQKTPEKETTCEMAGYYSWTNNIPLWAPQGVQFHQPIQNLEDSVNKNIANRDNGLFVKDLEAAPAVFQTDTATPPVTTLVQAELPYIQGGAAPYQIIPGGLWNDQTLLFSRGRADIYEPDGAGNPTTTKYNYYEKNAVAQSNNGMYQYSLAKVAYNTLPYDFEDFSTTLKNGGAEDYFGSWVYDDPIVLESLRFKGGLLQTAPNSIKLFCSNYIDETLCNLGPYYNALTNNTIDFTTAKPGVTPSSDFLLYRDFVDDDRNNNYFNYLSQKIKLSVPEGNISSTRVAELLTEELKERTGNVDGLTNGVGISPAIYNIYSKYSQTENRVNTDTTNTDIGVVKKVLPIIASKTFQSYPTMAGLMWETAYQSNTDNATANGVQGWSCVEPEYAYWDNLNKNNDTLPLNRLQQGNSYDTNQALNKFYKIMMSGNPNEWRCITHLNPMIQSTPVTADLLTTIGNGGYLQFQQYSIYTGLQPNSIIGATDYANQFIAVRKASDRLTKITDKYKIGNYGCASCILEGGYLNLSSTTDDAFNNIIVTNPTRAFMCEWYLGSQRFSEASTTADGNVYNTFGRTTSSMIYSKSQYRLKYRPKKGSMLVTNIIFDGNIDLSVWDKNYELVKKILPNLNSDNNITSDSPEFFDSNYVEWVIGRIDDAYSYPGTISHNIQTFAKYSNAFATAAGLTPPVPNRTGTPRFLPNIYQTYKLFQQQPFKVQTATTPTINSAIMPIYSWKTQNITIKGANYDIGGNYASVNEPIGTEQENMSTFTTNTNPQNNFYADIPSFAHFSYDPFATGADEIQAGKQVFGIPSWSTSADDFTDEYKTKQADWYKSSENQDQNPSIAYQKGCRRFIKGYRFLPQDTNIYTAQNAWEELIPLPSYISAKFSTRPSGLVWTQPDFFALWNKLLSLNDGKGIGAIPLFYKKSILDSLKQPGDITPGNVPNQVADIPFLAIILQEQDAKDEFLMPETGEYISLGSTPSLSQNILSFPCSTQQTNLQTDLDKLADVKLTGNGKTNVRENYYQQNVGVNNAFNSQDETIAIGSGARANIDKSNKVRTLDGFNPSQSTNMTEYLGSGGKTYSPCISIGANDPVWDYDVNNERFSLSNLHTAKTTGNGVFQLGSFGSNSSPETQIETAYVKTSAFSQQVSLPVGYYSKNNDCRCWKPPNSAHPGVPYAPAGGVYPMIDTQQSTYPNNTTYDIELPINTNIAYFTTTSNPPAFPNFQGPSWCSATHHRLNQNYNLPKNAYGNSLIPVVNQDVYVVARQAATPPLLPSNLYATTQLPNMTTDYFKPGTTYGTQSVVTSTFTSKATDTRTIPLRILMAQSVDGNVIKQTYPALNGYTGRKFYNGDGEEIVKDVDNTWKFASIEPGNIMYSPGAGNREGAYRAKINLPLLFGGSKTDRISNATYMSPYDITQFKVRCLNTPQVLDGNYIFSATEITDDLLLSSDYQFLLPPTLIPYAYIRQDSSPNVCNTAQSGMGITGLSIYKSDNTTIALNSISYKLFKGTLLSKLGFELGQFLPQFSQVQNILIPAKYNNYLNSNSNAYLIFSNQLSPITTNGLSSTSDALALTSGFITASEDANRAYPNIIAPMYNLGLIFDSGSTNQTPAKITATGAPNIITYPYLVVHSNIISGCANQYIGGFNGQQLLPVIASLQTNYAVGDFTYSGRSDLNFLVTKQTPISEIKTSIHFPNGELAEPILGESSAVLYRIDFAERGDDGYTIPPEERKDKK